MLIPKPTKQVCKWLDSAQEKQFSQVWAKILMLLKEPRPNDSKKIGEHEGDDLYRADAGEFRIVYSFDANTLRLRLIGKRNDAEVYKSLRNKLKK